MKCSRSLLVVGVTAALVAGPAMAHKKTTSQDSLYSWGRWSVLSPAAGGPRVTLVAVTTLETPQSGSNTAQINGGGVSSCAAGAGCGFASDQLASYQLVNHKPVPIPGALVVANFSGSPSALAAAYGGQSGQSFSFTVTPSGGSGQSSLQISVPSSVPSSLPPSLQIPASPGASGAVQGSAQITVPNGWQPAGPTTDYYASLTNQYSAVSQVLPYGANADVMYGYWQNGKLYYWSHSPFFNSQQSIVAPARLAQAGFAGGSGWFVTGTTTGLTAMANLQGGNVQASYAGQMLGSGTPVAINVDFGRGTWNGSWNGSTGAVIARGTQITGFTASGIVSGSNIVTNKLSSGLSGNVGGAFFGSNAGVLAGGVDVHSATASDTGVFMTAR